MATIYRKATTRPMPENATIITKKSGSHAQWIDAKGKSHIARLTRNGERICLESLVWTAKYRNANGRVIEVSTGCHDKTAAQQVLARLTRNVELERQGISTEDISIHNHLRTDIIEHIDDYVASLVAKGTTRLHRHNTKTQILRVLRECQWTTLGDFDRLTFEKWLAARSTDGMSARNRNAHRVSLVAFCNWLANPSIKRLKTNPFASIRKANEKSDPRRPRRAFSEDELKRLLDVAKRRTLKGSSCDHRYLIYKTLALTGLRKSELASITIAQVHVDAANPSIQLYAKDEKSRRGAIIPLPTSLADELRAFIVGRKPSERLFCVQANIDKFLRRDLKHANIQRIDHTGRQLDVHSLRYTFCSLLAKANVPLATAVKLMRHTDVKLTVGIYTDAGVLNTGDAVNSLPTL